MSTLLFLIHGWESADMEGQLYELFHAILYKGLDHLHILIFVGILEPPPPLNTEGQFTFWGS